MIHVVDVGASARIGGKPIYQPLIDANLARVTGFEPDPEAHTALVAAARPGDRYLPIALGDGRRHTLHVCTSPGMTSILVPNRALLAEFPRFAEWGRVERTVEIDTVRLDDAGVGPCDLIKLDVQGYELEILKHGEAVLSSALVVQVEVEFVPMYVDQPLFADVDAFLRARGFGFHRFHKLKSRIWKPYPAKTPYEGLSQHLWADAVYVRGLFDPASIPADRRETLAVVLDKVYGSRDLALRIRSIAK